MGVDAQGDGVRPVPVVFRERGGLVGKDLEHGEAATP
jgi:hypothetical protein